MIRAAALIFGFFAILAGPAAHAELTEVERADGVVLTVPLPGMTSTVEVTKTCWKKSGESESQCEKKFKEKYGALVRSMATDANPNPTPPACAAGSGPPTTVNGVSYQSIDCAATVPGIPDGGTAGGGFIQTFFVQIYGWLAGIAGIVALLMIVWGALEITTSGGGSGVQSGKNRIFAALGGLAMLLLIGIILKTINPAVYNPPAAGAGAAGATDRAACYDTCNAVIDPNERITCNQSCVSAFP